jgi:mannose-6-phosphate isomerase-like protein (cupin superfamily)
MTHNNVIVSTIDSPAEILGVHGGSGSLFWKRLATGSHLYGDWEGFEWVALPPGDSVGRHTHTHTEEVFYFLSGTGLVTVDGEERRVGPADVVVTPLNSWQRVVNDGEEDLAYLVIEVFPPEISKRWPARQPTDDR